MPTSLLLRLFRCCLSHTFFTPHTFPLTLSPSHSQAAALRHVATRLAADAVGTLRAAVASYGGGSSKTGGLAFEGPAWNNSTVAMIRWVLLCVQLYCLLVAAVLLSVLPVCIR